MFPWTLVVALEALGAEGVNILLLSPVRTECVSLRPFGRVYTQGPHSPLVSRDPNRRGGTPYTRRRTLRGKVTDKGGSKRSSLSPWDRGSLAPRCLQVAHGWDFLLGWIVGLLLSDLYDHLGPATERPWKLRESSFTHDRPW